MGGLGALGGFVIPPVMGFAVHDLGTRGYAIGFIVFVFLAMFGLAVVWVLKYTREAPAVDGQLASAPRDAEQKMTLGKRLGSGAYAASTRVTENNLKISITLLILLSMFSPSAWPQTAPAQSPGDDFVSKWFQRPSRADAEQPHWMAPLFTVTPRLVQQVRYDIGWLSKAGSTTTNFGGGKGLELVPAERAEILVSLPPYITHSSPQARDGFGDMAFLFKYRAAAGNEERGNYIVTALFGATVPTGSYSNGTTHALLTPSLGLGKGWGNFDVQSTVGVTLPTGDVNKLGTPVAFKTAFQYRVLKKLWPELEVNSTFRVFRVCSG